MTSEVEAKTAESGAGDLQPVPSAVTVVALWVADRARHRSSTLRSSDYMVIHWTLVRRLLPRLPDRAPGRSGSHGSGVPKLRRVEFSGSWLGLIPLAMGTLTLLIGRLGIELMNMRISFVLTLIGLVLLLLGRRAFRILAFPLLFLFLMVPLPQSVVNIVAFPLQLMRDGLRGERALPARDPRAARGEHHPPGEYPALRRGGLQRAPVADGPDHAGCDLRLLLPQVDGGTRHHRALRDSDRDPGERLPRRADRRSSPTTWARRRRAAGSIRPRASSPSASPSCCCLLEAWLLSLLWPKSWRGSRKRRAAT